MSGENEACDLFSRELTRTLFRLAVSLFLILSATGLYAAKANAAQTTAAKTSATDTASPSHQTLSMLQSWNNNHSAVINVPVVFVDEVSEISGGQIGITTYGPEVIAAFEQVRPVSNGAFDILFTHGLYHTGTSWMGATLDAVPSDIEWRRKSGVWDTVDQYYISEHNLKVLAIAVAETGFRIFLNKAVSTKEDMAGKSIRALQTQQCLMDELATTPVLLPPSEIYSAVEKKVVDGLIWTGVGAYGFKFHEVAPYIIEPSFGNVSYLILMNNDTYTELSSENQQILLEAGRRVEAQSIQRFNALYEQERRLMLAEGAQFVSMPSFSSDFANECFARGVWETAIRNSSSKDSIEALRKLVIKQTKK